LVAGVISIATSISFLGLLAGVCAAAAGALAWVATPSAQSLSPTAIDEPDPVSATNDDPSDHREPEPETATAQVPETESDLAIDHDLDPRPAIGARPAKGSHSPAGGWASEGQLLVDPVTALYSESYLLVALDARIAAARRRLRPVSVVMVEVVEGLATGRTAACDPKIVADAVRTTLREADTASRMNDGRYALVLEDTPETGAIWTVERLRNCLLEEHRGLTIWAGVACYPAHAFNLDEILVQATTALESAKEWRQDRIEVATAD
jgi:two-component system cell cycle response regulator